MRYLLPILLLVFTGNAVAQNTIRSYEYWFDNKEATPTKITISPGVIFNLDTDIPITDLLDGLHGIHLRFKDDSAQYSAIVSQFFYKYTTPQFNSKQITGYQFWFDGNEASGIVQNVPAKQAWLYMEAIDLAALSEGIHTFSIRFKDDEGEWSGAVSQFFYKYTPPQMSSKKITGYQYWFDADYGERHAVSIIPATSFVLSDSLSLAALRDGLHTISIRCKDEADQ